MLGTISFIFALASFGGIILILAKKIPQIINISDEEIQKNPHPIQIIRVYLVNKGEKILNIWNNDFFINGLEKILRRIKLLGMKLDRYCHNIILKIKNGAEADKDSADLNYIKKINDIVSNEANSSEIKNNLIKTIVENPKNINAYKELGRLCFKIKNYSDAKEAFLQVLKINPEDEEAKKYLNYLGN